MPLFQKIQLKSFPAIQEKETSEAKYWKSFKVQAESKFPGAPNTISFSPVDNSYIISGSTRLSLFDRNDKIQRSYTRFADEVYSGP